MSKFGLNILLFFVLSVKILSAQDMEFQNPEELVNKISAANENEKLNIYNSLSYAYIYNDLNLSIYYAKCALEIADKTMQAENNFVPLLNLARAYYSIPEIDSFYFYYNLAKEIAVSCNNKYIKAKLNIADADFGAMLRLQITTYDNYVAARNYFASINDKQNEIYLIIKLGNLFSSLNDFNAAYENYNYAKEILSEFHGQNNFSYLYLGLGYYYLLKNEIDSSFHFLKIVFSDSENNNFELGIASSASRIGEIYLNNIKDNKLALKYFTKAYDVYTKLGDIIDASNIATKISHIYDIENNHKKNLEYNFLALKLRTKVGNKLYIGSSYINIGYAFFKNKDIENALNYFKKAETVLRNVTNHQLKNNLYKKYELLYSETGNYKEALNSNYLANSYKDSIKFVENDNQLTKYVLKNKFQKENSKIQAVLLSRENIKYLSLLTVIIFLVLFGFILTFINYSNFRKNKDLNKLTSEQNQAISLQTKDLRDEISERHNAEMKLENALKYEKEMNQLKSKFVSIVSHEFRTPLSGIKSSTELLKRVFLNIKDIYNTGKIFYNIEKETERITNLMNDILLLGRIDSGKILFTPILVDILSEIDEFLNSKYKSANGNLSIKKVIEGKPYKIIVDAYLILQILDILISNAIKYNDGTKLPELEIIFRDDFLEIKVTDFGIGIPEEQKEFLFQSFFRGSNVQNFEGTGLGLTIAKQFVNLHHGDIKIESKENFGTKVNVKIPIQKNFSLSTPQ